MRKLESLGEPHPMVPKALLLSPPLDWLHLVLLSLSHCPPMVPWFLLLRNFWGSKLSRKLESLGVSHPMVSQALLLSPPLHWLHLVLLRLDQCHPMVAKHLRALAAVLSLPTPTGACSHVHQKCHHRHTCLRGGAVSSQLRCNASLAVRTGRVDRLSTNEPTDQNRTLQH